jgi:hypothetical protein
VSSSHRDRHPELAAIVDEMRKVFGAVRMTYLKDSEGEWGKPIDGNLVVPEPEIKLPIWREFRKKNYGW